jgi:hypothetical protein
VALPALLVAGALPRREWWRAGASGAILLLALWMIFGEPNRVRAIEATLDIPTLPNKCNIKIAHLSDIQTLQFSGREERALELVNQFDPDVVVITGDLTASGQHPVLVAHLHDWLSRLKTKTKRYVVNGDSDLQFDELVRGAAVTYLKDTGESLEVNGARLYFGGLDNRRRPPDPKHCLGGAPADATKIFLAHNPDYFLSPTPVRADLGLAGHTHGGQVHIPGLGPVLTFTHIGPRYAEGVFPKSKLEPELPWNSDNIVICPGLGMEGGYAPRVRLLCPPSVVLLTIRGPQE